MTDTVKVSKGSRIARAAAARLFAVQAVYQALQNGHSSDTLIEEYLSHRVGMELDGEKMLQPDGALFQQIAKGVGDRQEDLSVLIASKMTGGKKAENLLQAILLCGAYELLAHHEFDAPVIISDYLNVTHAFYEGTESRLVNAVLDAISKEIRPLS